MTDADVVDVLLDDHRLLRDLIDQLDCADAPSDMRRIYVRLVDEVFAHEAAEEGVVFPALRAAAPAAVRATLDRMGEHEEVDQLMEEMERLDPSGPGFLKRACALVLDLAAHLDAEEETTIPLIRDAIPHARRVELAREVAIAKATAPAFRAAHVASGG